LLSTEQEKGIDSDLAWLLIALLLFSRVPSSQNKINSDVKQAVPMTSQRWQQSLPIDAKNSKWRCHMEYGTFPIQRRLIRLSISSKRDQLLSRKT
jgi:hypothetical protein